MQGLIEDAIQATGWIALKILTIGACTRRPPGDRLLEGAAGFLTIVAIAGVVSSC